MTFKHYSQKLNYLHLLSLSQIIAVDVSWFYFPLPSAFSTPYFSPYFTLSLALMWPSLIKALIHLSLTNFAFQLGI